MAERKTPCRWADYVAWLKKLVEPFDILHWRTILSQTRRRYHVNGRSAKYSLDVHDSLHDRFQDRFLPIQVRQPMGFTCSALTSVPIHRLISFFVITG